MSDTGHTPPPRPKFRASAVVVLVRGAPPAREVFWVRRSDVVPYMPGFHAFVGGGVNAGDSVIAEQLAATAPEAETLEPGDFDATALLVLEACAIRETFEETGVLLGLGPQSGPLPDAAMLADIRRRVLDGSLMLRRRAANRACRYKLSNGLSASFHRTRSPHQIGAGASRSGPDRRSRAARPFGARFRKGEGLIPRPRSPLPHQLPRCGERRRRR